MPSVQNTPSESAPEKERASLDITQNYSKKRVGEGDVKLDKDKMAYALEKEKKRKVGGDDDDRSGKKRKGIDVGTHEVTEEELGMSPSCVVLNLTNGMCRGIPHEKADNGRSNGELCR